MSSKYNLTALEEIIFNEGERLIPGKTHQPSEFIRHFSSYKLFKELILCDIKKKKASHTIADLGCGVGYCCKYLSDIVDSKIIGVDNSDECKQYALENYNASNIEYIVADLTSYIPNMKPVDYVVSRGVFEHIENGLQLASQVLFNRMFIFDVPYDENPKNKYHILNNIIEKNFCMFKSIEFYYQDLEGNITKNKVGKPNMIGVICTK